LANILLPSVGQTLTDPRVWHLACISFTYLIGLYAMSFWMPQAIKGLSSRFSNTAIGFLVMVPHLAGVAAMIVVARSSDRRLERRYHAAVPLMIGGAALILLHLAASAGLAIMLWSFVAMGIYSFLGPFWALPTRFLSGLSAASGIALINSVGNLGGFAGPSAIGLLTRNAGGMYRGLALTGVSLLLSAVLLLFIPKDTRRISGA
jgi:ACS family tartrate transporter-like MFS transporter